MRLAHYLAHLDVDRLVIAVSPGSPRTRPLDHVAAPTPPTGIDLEALSRVPQSPPRSVRRCAGRADHSPIGLPALMGRAGQRCRTWRTTRTAFSPATHTNSTSTGCTRGPTHVSSPTWRMCCTSDSRAFDSGRARPDSAPTEHLVGSPLAYLVATGPSAREALDIDMSDGVRIVCNTSILDDELMDHVRRTSSRSPIRSSTSDPRRMRTRSSARSAGPSATTSRSSRSSDSRGSSGSASTSCRSDRRRPARRTRWPQTTTLVGTRRVARTRTS